MNKLRQTAKFYELAKLEPRLSGLLKEARSIRSTGSGFCANRVWFRDFKPRIVKLVGWDADTDIKELQTHMAYDIVYRQLYDALPNCQHEDPFC